MPRFVVLLHEKKEDVHWDLMLEAGDALATWAMPPRPLPLESLTVRARRLPDHRRAYLDYEGPVGGDRGTVRRVDSGRFETLPDGRFRLHGEQFNGVLTVRDEDDHDSRLVFDVTRL